MNAREWYRMMRDTKNGGVAVERGEFSCPNCGEVRLDHLPVGADGLTRCATCREEYEPSPFKSDDTVTALVPIPRGDGGYFRVGEPLRVVGYSGVWLFVREYWSLNAVAISPHEVTRN